MSRTWLYTRMVTDPTLLTMLRTSTVDDNDTPDNEADDTVIWGPMRVYQSTSLDAAPHDKPFIMYRQTSDVEVIRGDDGDAARSVGYMVFVHDIPGDYLRIDDIMTELKRLFKDTVDQPNGVIRSRWTETSEDLRDEDMGTIMQFARIQVIHKV